MLTRAIIELESETHRQLEQLAAARHQPSALLLREAVEQFLHREKQRADFLEQTLAALRSYETTGLHLTQNEMDLWLDRVEAGEDVLPPECHT